MTPNILQSDIELARKLLVAKRPEGEIVMALTRRGVDAAKATSLVADLRRGRAVSPEMAVVRRTVTEPRAVAAEDLPAKAGGGQPQASPANPRGSGSRSPGQQRPNRSGRPWTSGLVAVVLVALLALVIGYFAFPTETRALWAKYFPAQPSQKTDAGPNTIKPTASPKGLEWELSQDGLRLAGKLVTRENAREALSQLLGSPTRTNQVEQTSKVIYAYDTHGLLVYSQRDAGNDSIVLDFEALGGAHGTLSPFVGTLKIQDAVIHSGTDAESLAANKTLALTRTGSDGGIFGGTYDKVGLCFVYRAGLQKLRSIEIDLKE